MKNTKIIFSLFLITTILISGCKTTKPVAGKETFTKNEEKRFFELLNNTVSFNTFTAKLDLNIKTGSQSISSKANMKLIKDEKLQISIQPFLGIEMARIELTNDSVKMIDRMNKRYVLESFAEYKTTLPIDISLSAIQALLLNQPFVPGKWVLVENDFKLFDWNLAPEGVLEAKPVRSGMFNYQFKLNSDNYLSKTRIGIENSKSELLWEYDNFAPLSNYQFPMKSAVKYNGSEKSVNINLIYSRIEIDKILQMDFPIPSSYQRVRLEDVIKSLIK